MSATGRKKKSRPARKTSASPSIQGLAAETREGRCVFCDAPLQPNTRRAPNRYPMGCKAEVCVKEHMRLLRTDRRRAIRAIGRSVARLTSMFSEAA